METFEPSGRLIREWETSGGMEEDGWCCCGGQACLHRRNPATELLFQRERRLRRVVHLLTVACVLLVSITLALLVTFALGVRVHDATVGQPRKQPPNSSAGYAEQQQLEELENPRAMLTAPIVAKNHGKYLQWENQTGRAFCHGGFSYSSGSLVVPRNGIYRVFLQITYEGNFECDELKLLNKVYYTCDDYSEDRCILSSVDTVTCNEDWDKQWSKSLYTSGLFYLKANGSLHVTSLQPHLIARNEYQVFFGAELLPP